LGRIAAEPYVAPFHHRAFEAKAPSLLGFVAGNQAAGRGDHPPPWETVAAGENVAHRSGRPRAPGLGGDLTVGDDLAGLQAMEHRADPPFELAVPSAP